MSKNLSFVLVVILVAAAVGVLGWYLTKDEATNANTSTTTTITTTNTAEVSPKPAAKTVWIAESSFTPSVITIEVGDTVTWVNKDDVKRQVASDPYPTHTDLPDFVSDELEKDDVFTYMFTEAGEFSYHDHLNPIKLGKVIVE